MYVSEKPTFFCDMTWDLEEKNGKDFIVFKTMECNSTMQRIYFDLYKFFEGNDELGKKDSFKFLVE